MNINLDSVDAFLELVKNADKFQKVVTDLKEQKKEIITLIELTGKVDTIPKLYKEAEDTLSKAKSEAERIIKVANDNASGIVTQAEALNSKTLLEHADLAKLSNETKELNKQAKELKKEVEQKAKQLNDELGIVKVQQDQLTTSQKELSDKLVKLQEVMK